MIGPQVCRLLPLLCAHEFHGALLWRLFLRTALRYWEVKDE